MNALGWLEGSATERAAYPAQQRDVAVEVVTRYNPDAVVCVGVCRSGTRGHNGSCSTAGKSPLTASSGRSGPTTAESRRQRPHRSTHVCHAPREGAQLRQPREPIVLRALRTSRDREEPTARQSSSRSRHNVSYSPPMGMWFPEPELKPDEVVSFQAAANFAKGRRAIGGQITVTDQRCLFVPNRLDGLTGASRIDVARGAISNRRASEVRHDGAGGGES